MSSAVAGPESSGQVKLPSERSFSVVFFVVFLAIGLFPLPFGGGVRYWAVGIALALLIVGMVRPMLLRPLNIVWFRFGIVLHHIISPLVMGIIFFVAVTPIGLLLRVAGKDVLALKIQPKAESYWIRRSQHSGEPSSMKNQF